MHGVCAGNPFNITCGDSYLAGATACHDCIHHIQPSVQQALLQAGKQESVRLTTADFPLGGMLTPSSLDSLAQASGLCSLARPMMRSCGYDGSHWDVYEHAEENNPWLAAREAQQTPCTCRPQHLSKAMQRLARMRRLVAIHIVPVKSAFTDACSSASNAWLACQPSACSIASPPSGHTRPVTAHQPRPPPAPRPPPRRPARAACKLDRG